MDPVFASRAMAMVSTVAQRSSATEVAANTTAVSLGSPGIGPVQNQPFSPSNIEPSDDLGALLAAMPDRHVENTAASEALVTVPDIVASEGAGVSEPSDDLGALLAPMPDRHVDNTAASESLVTVPEIVAGEGAGISEPLDDLASLLADMPDRHVEKAGDTPASIESRVSALNVSLLSDKDAAAVKAKFQTLLKAIPEDRNDLKDMFFNQVSRIPQDRLDQMFSAQLNKDLDVRLGSLQRDLDKSNKINPEPHGERLAEVRAMATSIRALQTEMETFQSNFSETGVDRLLKSLNRELQNTKHVESGRTADAAFYEGINNNYKGLEAEFRTGVKWVEQGCKVEFGAKTLSADTGVDLDIDIKATKGQSEYWIEVKNYKSFTPASSNFEEIRNQLARLQASAKNISLESPKPRVCLHFAREVGETVQAEFEKQLGAGHVMVGTVINLPTG